MPNKVTSNEKLVMLLLVVFVEEKNERKERFREAMKIIQAREK
jgi:hypothetical protein